MTMTPHSVYDTVTDQYGQPVAAAQVAIRDEDGALVDLDGGNPIMTDSDGLWTALLLPGEYTLVITKGTAIATRTLTVCQDVERTPFLAEVDELPDLIVNDIITLATIDDPIVLDAITIEAV